MRDYLYEFVSLCMLINFAVASNIFTTTSPQSTGTFADCNGKITLPGTIITSENYPEPYPNYKTCQIDIEFKKGELVELTFLDFDILGKSNRYKTGCDTYGNYEYLQLSDGLVDIGRPYCKFNQPTILSTNRSYSETMTIRFRAKYSSHETPGRGFKMKVDTAPKCYCKNKDGNVEKNEILCGSRGVFNETLSCNPSSWCTGSSDEKSAVIKHSWILYELCKEASTSCGDGSLAPNCGLCPKNEDSELNTWCSDQCFYCLKYINF